MRALFVCPNLEIGGAERQWQLLVPGLFGRGVVVRVLTLDGEGPVADALRAERIIVQCARMSRRSDLAGLFRALRFAPRDLDVVVSRSVSGQVVGGLIARHGGAAHVAAEHIQYDLLPLRPHRHALMRLIAPRVDVAVAVADEQIEPLIRLGYRASRIRVIPNGVAPLQPGRSRRNVRATLGLSDHHFVACLVAALRPEKRVEDFVVAVASASSESPLIRGLVAGAGPELERVSELARRLGGSTLVLGERSDVADLIAASDAACLSSVSEALPMFLLEAMSLGKPLVATDVGGVARLVVPQQTGILVAPRDVSGLARAFITVERDRPRALRMGQAARALFGERFTAERMVDAYYDLLLGLRGDASISRSAPTTHESELRTGVGA